MNRPEITFINQNGELVTKHYDSPFFFRKALEKIKRSKKLTLVSHSWNGC